MTAYHDADYRAARATLTPTTPCWHARCTTPATTIDHVPALARHNHRRGSGCCALLPCCAPHNYGAGARLGNRARQPRPYASRRW